MFYLLYRKQEAEALAEQFSNFFRQNSLVVDTDVIRTRIAQLLNFGSWQEMSDVLGSDKRNDLDISRTEGEIEVALSRWTAAILDLHPGITTDKASAFISRFFPKKPRLFSFSEIAEGLKHEYVKIVIGLNETYRPQIVEESSAHGTWTSFVSTTEAERLVLKFNDKLEFCAQSDRQFGSRPGEVSIPDLLVHLHYLGQVAQYQGRKTDGKALSDLSQEFAFHGPSFYLLHQCGVEFTEASYNAILAVGPENGQELLKRLAAAEAILNEQGVLHQEFFVKHSPQREYTPLDSEFVIAMERVLDHCRHLLPRNPDESLNHYYHNLPEIMTTRRPPLVVQTHVKESASPPTPTFH
jgi:hypothetical protein